MAPHLGLGCVDLRLGILGDRTGTDVPDDSNDGTRLVSGIVEGDSEAYLPANGIFPGVETIRKALVDEDSRRRVAPIRGQESPTAYQRDSEGLEVAGSDHFQNRSFLLAGRWCRSIEEVDF